LDFDSVCSGVSVPMTAAAIGLMMVQSAVDTVVELTMGVVALATGAAVVAAAVVGAALVAAAEVAGALEEELDELLQPAMRAPPAARTARADSVERLDISGTSMGVERSVASHENLVLP